MDLPLSGVRILDFTRAIAGPYATTMLACLGAEVIKVESRSRPDVLRVTGLAADLDRAHGFIVQNVNKRSLSVNLARPAGVNLILQLAKVSDVVIENMRGGAMDGIGLSYDILASANPGLVVLSAPPAGVGGVAGGYAGVAPVFAALSGFAHLTGYEEGPPERISDLYGDPQSGSAMAFIVLAALYERELRGEGQFIDFSSVENLATYIGPAFMDLFSNGREGERLGSADPLTAPHGVYRCKGDDHWIAFEATDETAWRACVQVLGLDDCLDDPRFADGYQRLRHRNELDLRINSATESRDAHELATLLQEADVPATAVESLYDVAQSPQIHSRGMVHVVEHPLIGQVITLGLPWVTDDFDVSPRTAGPLLGADNAYVLQEIMGLSESEIEQLTREKVIE